MLLEFSPADELRMTPLAASFHLVLKIYFVVIKLYRDFKFSTKLSSKIRITYVLVWVIECYVFTPSSWPPSETNLFAEIVEEDELTGEEASDEPCLSLKPPDPRSIIRSASSSFNIPCRMGRMERPGCKCQCAHFTNTSTVWASVNRQSRTISPFHVQQDRDVASK